MPGTRAETPPQPGHEFRPRNPGGVVSPGLRLSVAAAFRGLSAGHMPAGSGVAPLADVPDGARRDGFSQLVVRCKHPVIAMPVLPRRWDKIGQTIGPKR
jgi:hypothetical protein